MSFCIKFKLFIVFLIRLKTILSIHKYFLFMQELPSGSKLDKTSVNQIVGQMAELAGSAHETLECSKTLLRTRGVKL